jgi:hypothetical protein
MNGGQCGQLMPALEQLCLKLFLCRCLPCRVTSGEASQAPTSHRIVTIAGEQEGLLKVGAVVVAYCAGMPCLQCWSDLG